MNSSSSMSGGILLIKLNLDGELLWIKTFGNEYEYYSHYCQGLSLLQTPDNGFILSGRYPVQLSNEYYPRFVLIKTDSEGNYD